MPLLAALHKVGQAELQALRLWLTHVIQAAGPGGKGQVGVCMRVPLLSRHLPSTQVGHPPPQCAPAVHILGVLTLDESVAPRVGAQNAQVAVGADCACLRSGWRGRCRC